jgi:hypothetical protein
MNRRSLLAAILGLLLVGGGIALFLALFERVSTTVPLPPEGEARYNPLYALRLSLQAQGVKAQSYPVLNPNALALGPRDTVLIYTQPEAISATQTGRLVAWVKGGGHLVLRGPGAGEAPGELADALGLEAAESSSEDEDPEDDAEVFEMPGCAVLSATSAPPKPATNKPTPAQAAQADDKEAKDAKGAKDAPAREVIRLCGTPFIGTLPQFEGHQGDSVHGYRFARMALGAGQVTVVSDLGFLANDQFKKRIAGELGYQVLAPRLGAGTVHLVYSADVPSLWRLLMLHGWMALLPALLALAAFLLLRGQRFGSPVPPPTANRRALLEHVQAAGEFAFRRGRMLSLHSAVLALFQRRLALRDPVLAALDGETLVAALAEKMNLAPDRVRLALRPVGLQRPDVFLQSVSTLVLMRNRL